MSDEKRIQNDIETEDQTKEQENDEIETVDLDQVSGGPAAPPGWHHT
jgi:hypothetical protein